jgi:hypothetical protein
MRTLIVFAAVWFAVAWSGIEAVQPAHDWDAVRKLVPGATVRVTAGPRRLTGTVQSATETTLTLLNQFRDVARFERSDVDLVEEFLGDPHPKRRGALKGALWSSLLLIPATISSEMGGMERKYLPLTYCLVICSGAAIGAWAAEDAKSHVVYRR